MFWKYKNKNPYLKIILRYYLEAIIKKIQNKVDIKLSINNRTSDN